LQYVIAAGAVLARLYRWNLECARQPHQRIPSVDRSQRARDGGTVITRCSAALAAKRAPNNPIWYN